MTDKIISSGSKYLMILKTRRIFSNLGTRKSLNEGTSRWNMGRMESRSMMAIGVKGWMMKAMGFFLPEM